MQDEYMKKVATIILVVVLGILAFLLLKPILLSIISGILLAFVFLPVYKKVLKWVKYQHLAASLVCIAFLIIIILPMWFLTPVLIDQSIKFYFEAQQLDVVGALKNVFPSFFASESFTKEVGVVLQSFLTKMSNSLVNSFSNIILNFPSIALHLLVVLFTFYFVMVDSEKLSAYIRSLLPFSKEVEKKLFDYSSGITISVLYGQIVVGICQGLIVGLGFFLFGVPNALFLTLVAIVAGILPIIGPPLVWVPVAIFLIMGGNNFAALGVSFFGIISSVFDNLLRSIIVSRRVSMHSSVVLIGMIGGFFLFGVLGFILGPLILAYLLVILEIYRNKKSPGILIQGNLVYS